MDWSGLLEIFRTENLISCISSLDPMEILSNPYVMIPFGLLISALAFFRVFKILALVTGCAALWYAVSYTIPRGGGELNVQELTVFGIICTAVLASWVYVFIIRGD